MSRDEKLEQNDARHFWKKRGIMREATGEVRERERFRTRDQARQRDTWNKTGRNKEQKKGQRSSRRERRWWWWSTCTYNQMKTARRNQQCTIILVETIKQTKNKFNEGGAKKKVQRRKQCRRQRVGVCVDERVPIATDSGWGTALGVYYHYNNTWGEEHTNRFCLMLW